MRTQDAPVQMAFPCPGGWDTHASQGAATGQLAGRLGPSARDWPCWPKRLGPVWDDTVVMVMSEFGRTVRQNGNGGTDHGHGKRDVAHGWGRPGRPGVRRWPGLSASALHEGRDLAVTTDFRQVVAEVLSGHLRLPASACPRCCPDGRGRAAASPGPVQGLIRRACARLCQTSPPSRKPGSARCHATFFHDVRTGLSTCPHIMKTSGTPWRSMSAIRPCTHVGFSALAGGPESLPGPGRLRRRRRQLAPRPAVPGPAPSPAPAPVIIRGNTHPGGWPGDQQLRGQRHPLSAALVWPDLAGPGRGAARTSRNRLQGAGVRRPLQGGPAHEKAAPIPSRSSPVEQPCVHAELRARRQTPGRCRMAVPSDGDGKSPNPAWTTASRLPRRNWPCKAC